MYVNPPPQKKKILKKILTKSPTSNFHTAIFENADFS